MIQIMRKSSCFLLVGLLLAFALSLSAQEIRKETIKCPECEYVNDWSKDTCTKCRASLLVAKQNTMQKSQEAGTESKNDGGFDSAVNSEKDVTDEIAKSSQDESEEVIEKGPIDPKRLFNIPTAEVLNSLDVNLGGGSSFGVKREETRPFLAHIRIGLGGISEVEVSTLGVINQLSEGSGYIPTFAFKLKLFSEGKWRPAFAGSLRSSLWHVEEIDGVPVYGTVNFEKRLSTLYFVASKTFDDVSVHFGLSLNDLRIRTRDTATDAPISPDQTEIDSSGKDYHNKNIFGPFFGIQIKINPKTSLMMEVEPIAAYEFDETNPFVTEDNINVEWLGIAGVRFFFFDWLAVDAGVEYRSYYNGIGDAHIQTGLNITVSLPRIAKDLWDSRRDI